MISIRKVEAFLFCAMLVSGQMRNLFPSTDMNFAPFKGAVKSSSVVSKKVCKLDIILIFALSNKKQQEYGTYTRTNFGNYFELHK